MGWEGQKAHPDPTSAMGRDSPQLKLNPGSSMALGTSREGHPQLWEAVLGPHQSLSEEFFSWDLI